MSTRISSARDEVAEAMCVVMRARDLAPELDAELQRIDDLLGSIRRRLDELAGDAAPSTVGSLYSYTAKPDDPEWESKFIALITLQVHVMGARSDLFGQDPDTPEDERKEYDEPLPSLERGEDLRQALDDIDEAVMAARQRLRDEPH